MYSLFLPPPASTVKISNQEAIPRKTILMGQIYTATNVELEANRYEKYQITVPVNKRFKLLRLHALALEDVFFASISSLTCPLPEASGLPLDY